MNQTPIWEPMRIPTSRKVQNSDFQKKNVKRIQRIGSPKQRKLLKKNVFSFSACVTYNFYAKIFTYFSLFCLSCKTVPLRAFRSPLPLQVYNLYIYLQASPLPPAPVPICCLLACWLAGWLAAGLLAALAGLAGWLGWLAGCVGCASWLAS